MKRGTPDHPKVVMLMEALGLPLYAAVGILELLWHWTARFARRGDVGRYPDSLIARGVGWDREPSELVQALIRTGWLDENPEHRLVVHDWNRHADEATKKALENAGERFVGGGEIRRESGASDSRKFSNQARAIRERIPLPDPDPDPDPSSELPSAERSRSPLLNLLKNLPGDEAEKLAFLADEGPQIEVDAAASGKPVSSVTVRYYRSYLKRGRTHEHAAEDAIRAAKRKAWHAEHGEAYEAHLRETGGVA